MVSAGLVVLSLLCLLKEYQGIELCAKLLFQTELSRTRRDQEFGFSVEAKVADSSFQSDELCVFVSDVAKGGPVAQKKGTNSLSRYQSRCNVPAQITLIQCVPCVVWLQKKRQ